MTAPLIPGLLRCLRAAKAPRPKGHAAYQQLLRRHLLPDFYQVRAPFWLLDEGDGLAEVGRHGGSSAVRICWSARVSMAR